jgi:hypothetical protein
MAINKFLIRLRPELFGFQLLVLAKARPMLAKLLADAEAAQSRNPPNWIEGCPCGPRDFAQSYEYGRGVG